MSNKFLLALAIISASVWTSCKEQPVYVDMGTTITTDTTYVASTVENPQDKKYLVEELSGVKCTNCPAGMAKLTEMNTNGPLAGKLVIASIHAGALTDMIDGYSKQDFVVPASSQLLELILGGDPGKPCASFDRYSMGQQNYLLLPNYNQWPANAANASDSASSTPVNITVSTESGIDENEFIITVKAHYTNAMSDQQMMTVYIVENDIIDAMEYTSTVDTTYKFKHVLRSYVTPPTGRQILKDIEITPGRVYEYKAVYKIDRSNPTEAVWNADNMNVIAFVSSGSPSTKRVYQVQEVKLKP